MNSGKIWKTISVLMVLTLLLGVFGCSSEKEIDSVNLSVMSLQIEGGPAAAVLQMYMDEVAEKSDGKITFDPVYWGTLGTPATFDDLIMKGSVDMGSLAYGYRPSLWYMHTFDMACMFGPSDPRIVVPAKIATFQEFPALGETAAQNNLKQLAAPVASQDRYSIWSNKPIRTLEDLNGMKLAAYGSLAKFALEAVGAVQVAAGMADFYEMMRQGTIDGFVLADDICVTYKLYEIAEWQNVISWGTNATLGLFMNMDVWNDLTPEQQEIFDEVGRDIAVEYAQVMVDRRPEIEKQLTDYGVSINTVPDDVVKQWAAAIDVDTGDWYASEAAKSGASESEVIEMIRFYQDEVEKLGYDWPRRWAVE